MPVLLLALAVEVRTVIARWSPATRQRVRLSLWFVWSFALIGGFATIAAALQGAGGHSIREEFYWLSQASTAFILITLVATPLTALAVLSQAEVVAGVLTVHPKLRWELLRLRRNEAATLRRIVKLRQKAFDGLQRSEGHALRLTRLEDIDRAAGGEVDAARSHELSELREENTRDREELRRIWRELVKRENAFKRERQRLRRELRRRLRSARKTDRDMFSVAAFRAYHRAWGDPNRPEPAIPLPRKPEERPEFYSGTQEID